MADASRAPPRALTLPAFLAAHPAAQPPKAVLPALYADLDAQRTSNPHAFTASLDKWHALLADAALLAVQLGTSNTTDHLVLHADNALQANWSIRGLGRPLGLGTVVSQLASERHLIRVSEFLASSQPLQSPLNTVGSSSSGQTLGRLALRMLSAPLWWSLAQIGIGGAWTADDDEHGSSSHGEGSAFWKKNVQGDWVLWRNLERITAAVLEAHYSSAASPIDHLYSPELLRTVLLPKAQKILKESGSTGAEADSPGSLSELDVKVVLKHLSRDKRLALVDSSGQAIKFASNQHAPGSVEKISESDRGIVQVRDAHSRLERQVGEVEVRIADRDARIRNALRAQPKQLAQAKTYLTSKKALEELLKRRLGALEMMSSVLLKLEQASGDIEIMQAYDKSTTTLKSLLSHPSLNLDKVEDTMAALSDAMADHTEVDDAIRAGSEGIAGQSGAADIDEDELERELAALEAESAREKQEAKAANAEAAAAAAAIGGASSSAGGSALAAPSAPAGALGNTATAQGEQAQAATQQAEALLES
ncbi:hypothetical protein OC835_006926 [Tilletia horrida]|nr:hypothetical protein OC835_006926 [Tilletia horrida]